MEDILVPLGDSQYGKSVSSSLTLEGKLHTGLNSATEALSRQPKVKRGAIKPRASRCSQCCSILVGVLSLRIG